MPGTVFRYRSLSFLGGIPAPATPCLSWMKGEGGASGGCRASRHGAGRASRRVAPEPPPTPSRPYSRARMFRTRGGYRFRHGSAERGGGGLGCMPNRHRARLAGPTGSTCACSPGRGPVRDQTTIGKPGSLQSARDSHFCSAPQSLPSLWYESPTRVMASNARAGCSCSNRLLIQADCRNLHGGWLSCSGLSDSNPAWHSDAVSGSHPPHPLSDTQNGKPDTPPTGRFGRYRPISVPDRRAHDPEGGYSLTGTDGFAPKTVGMVS
jgi:hypothetical protein